MLVPFGYMSLYDVNGQNNTQTKTVTVSCDSYQGTPYIRIDGTVLKGAGNNVLQTTGANSSTLGIALYQGGDDKDRILFLVGLLLTVCDAHRMAMTKSSGVKVRII